MTPLLWPDWWVASSGSFSSTVKRRSGRCLEQPVGRRQPDDPAADHGDIGTLGHPGVVRLPVGR